MIKVACVGVGYFSRFHLDGWDRIDGVVCDAVADQNFARAKATGRTAFATAEAMIAETRPDILDIILPPAAQAAVIRRAIAHGVPTIICQKPFCISQDEAERVTQEAEAAGLRLIVHENFRFQPWFRAVKAQIDGGAIGQLQNVTWRLRPGDGQGPRAYLDRQPYFQTMPRLLIHETGVHYIDTFRYLLGEPSSVYADLRQLNPAIAGEDASHVIFAHPGGVRAVFDGNRHLDHAAVNTRCTMGEGLFEGTMGALTITGDGAVHLRLSGATETTEVLPPDTSENFGGDCTYHLQAHVVAALKGDGQIENTARDYLRVLAIENAIYSSADKGMRLDLPQDADD